MDFKVFSEPSIHNSCDSNLSESCLLLLGVEDVGKIPMSKPTHILCSNCGGDLLLIIDTADFC